MLEFSPTPRATDAHKMKEDMTLSFKLKSRSITGAYLHAIFLRQNAFQTK
jgi:hypothetical protein